MTTIHGGGGNGSPPPRRSTRRTRGKQVTHRFLGEPRRFASSRCILERPARARVIEEPVTPVHGVERGEPRIDLDKLRAWKESVVQKLTGTKIAKQRAVRYVQGTASLADTNTVVRPQRRGSAIGCQHIILRQVRVRDRAGVIDDSPRVLDSTSALDCRTPKSLLVVGGGYIGLELGTVCGLAPG